MSDQEHPEKKWSKAEMLERIRTAYEALEGTLRPLSPAQLSLPGPEGWAVKDHLTHLAAWELGIAELLRRRPRFAAMQIDKTLGESHDFDAINTEIYRQNAALSPAEALEKFRAAHRQMLQALEPLGDEDLYQPYTAYLPPGSPGRQDPVLNWIAGNTFGHFEEHNEWIRKILSSGQDQPHL